MKALLVALVVLVVAITIAAGSAATGSAASAFPSPQDQTISCNSDEMDRHFCPADTRGGVQMVKQHSEAACIFGRTWGYDDRGIWVDRGCRADFQIGGASEWRPGGEGMTTVTCSSDDMGRHFCPADTRGGVQMVKQHSEAACIFDRTWGYNDRGIWVDRGCRADFQIRGASWKGWDSGYNIYCASDDGRRHVCPTDTRGGIRLVRKRSDASCDFGRSWGYDRNGIWVDHGCRADFEIGGGASAWRPGGEGMTTITCSSDDMRRHFCPADTRGGVQLIRQRSDADCIYGQTWGYGRRGIWVDQGCRADFQIGYRR